VHFHNFNDFIGFHAIWLDIFHAIHWILCILSMKCLHFFILWVISLDLKHNFIKAHALAHHFMNSMHFMHSSYLWTYSLDILDPAKQSKDILLCFASHNMRCRREQTLNHFENGRPAAKQSKAKLCFVYIYQSYHSAKQSFSIISWTNNLINLIIGWFMS